MKKYIIVLFLALAANWVCAQKQDTLRIRVMTYNLRFGELASLEQIAEHIKAFQPDFVALQEVDSKTFAKGLPNKMEKISLLNWDTVRRCILCMENPSLIKEDIMASEYFPVILISNRRR